MKDSEASQQECAKLVVYFNCRSESSHIRSLSFIYGIPPVIGNFNVENILLNW